ncbi:hypothetical protein ACE939_00635 [Aquimarina sp. W85]|uniref:hypothetical protein n=1 Tax=Aquimarina rhodophyticola TaxID=3342246 RepID=UPI0036701C43
MMIKNLSILIATAFLFIACESESIEEATSTATTEKEETTTEDDNDLEVIDGLKKDDKEVER